MSLSDVELGRIIDDLRGELIGSRIALVWQQSSDCVHLDFLSRALMIVAAPKRARLHWSPLAPKERKVAQKSIRREMASEQPFFLLLRKYLKGSLVTGLSHVPKDRVATIRFERRAEEDDERPPKQHTEPNIEPDTELTSEWSADFGSEHNAGGVVVQPAKAVQVELVLELTARPNLILLDKEGLVLGSLTPISGGQRQLAPGEPYALPQAGVTSAPWIGTDRFAGSVDRHGDIASHYAAIDLSEAILASRRALTTQLARVASRFRTKQSALAADLAAAHEAEQHRKWGDLITAHLHQVRRGASAVSLPDDFVDGSPLQIPLDPALSPLENATRYYKSAKRKTGAISAIKQRIADVETQLAVCNALSSELQVASAKEEFAEIEQRLLLLSPAALPPKERLRRERTERALPYREFRSLAGDTIWVGRNAQGNDQLTFRYARGNDLWLHTRDVPGAHVIVRLGRDQPTPEQTLLDAATLAMHFSPARDALDCDVSYTHRKHVRRVSGGQPGLVTVSLAKTLRIRMDPARLTRLMGQRAGSSQKKSSRAG